MAEVWTGGVGSNIARKLHWFWHSDTEIIEWSNFWPGWSGGDRADPTRELQQHNAMGIKLGRSFPLQFTVPRRAAV